MLASLPYLGLGGLFDSYAKYRQAEGGNLMTALEVGEDLRDTQAPAAAVGDQALPQKREEVP
jgi:hypothetical protein